MTAEKKTADGQDSPTAGRKSTGALSCRRPLEYAIVLAAGFLLMHLLGYRRDPGLLVGTQGTEVAAHLGLVYMLLYVAFVLVVPVLLIASVLLKCAGVLGRRLERRQGTSSPHGPS